VASPYQEWVNENPEHPKALERFINGLKDPRPAGSLSIGEHLKEAGKKSVEAVKENPGPVAAGVALGAAGLAGLALAKKKLASKKLN